MLRSLIPLVALLALAVPARAQDAALETLAGGLKPLLLGAMPAVLHEKSTNWGHQEPTPNGIRWHGLKPEVMYTPKNDGRWRKVKLTTQDLPRTLDVRCTDFRTIDAERQGFKVFLTMQVGVEFEQQNWESGVRLWSGSVRARIRLKLALDCENVMKLEQGKGLIPDLVFRLRVVGASVDYDNLVVEHINGVGGSAARLTGEALRGTLKHVKPSLERDLLEKANRAIVRAADTREVRVGLGGLARKK